MPLSKDQEFQLTDSLPRTVRLLNKSHIALDWTKDGPVEDLEEIFVDAFIISARKIVELFKIEAAAAQASSNKDGRKLEAQALTIGFKAKHIDAYFDAKTSLNNQSAHLGDWRHNQGRWKIDHAYRVDLMRKFVEDFATFKRMLLPDAAACPGLPAITQPSVADAKATFNIGHRFQANPSDVGGSGYSYSQDSGFGGTGQNRSYTLNCTSDSNMNVRAQPGWACSRCGNRMWNPVPSTP